MPRAHLRSVKSSYELEDDTDKNPHSEASIDLGGKVGEGDFSDYDSSAYYLRASDRNGHVINITIPTTYGPAIAQLVESDLTPYKSKVDVARDALVHGIVRRLMEIRDHGAYIDASWFAEVQMQHLREKAEKDEAYVNGLEQSLELLAAHEDWASVLNLCRTDEPVPLPPALARRRDSLIDRFRARVPAKYHPSYDTE